MDRHMTEEQWSLLAERTAAFLSPRHIRRLLLHRPWDANHPLFDGTDVEPFVREEWIAITTPFLRLLQYVLDPDHRKV